MDVIKDSILKIISQIMEDANKNNIIEKEKD
jgi:hypothetical protein